MRKIKIDEFGPLPKRPIENLNFESLSEYACAKMLEKYTGWIGIEGVTFQVPVGRAVYDFRLNNTFIEYHPISLRREFLTGALHRIMSVTNHMSKHDKITVMKAISDEMEAQYDKRRGQTLAAHPLYGSMELICAHSQEEFIHKVIYKFSPSRCPNMSEMTKEFRNLQKSFRANQIDMGRF